MVNQPSTPGLRQEFRSLLRPERRWHYAFHLLVILVAATYWSVSAHVSRGGLRTMAETVLYRPDGDSQLWPIITALSQFNFGDPTDAFSYGQGVQTVPIVPLLPHAMACAVFGLAGFAVADVLLAWIYFVAVALFLRMAGVGRFASLVIGSALATGALQVLLGLLADAFAVVIDPLKLVASEYFFPNLLELKIYGNRIQRPMVTEIWVVLGLAALMRLWREPTATRFSLGAGLGLVMGLALQGDFYSLGVLGLMLAAVLARVWSVCGWKPPARLVGGILLGAASVAWVFVWQRLGEHPDLPRRLGLTNYDRTSLLFLPGYAALLRVLVVGAAAWALATVAARVATIHRDSPTTRRWSSPEGRLALFFVLLLTTAYQAQPIQIFLLGQAAQIYHYVANVPVFYSYAMLILAFHLVRLLVPSELIQCGLRLATTPGRSGAAFLCLVLGCGWLLAAHRPVKRIYHLGTVTGASVEYQPWGKFGDLYRPALSLLDRGLTRDPKFGAIRTIATFNQDVYVLLCAFRGKRAITPDACTTVISDLAIEERLCLMARIFQLTPESFIDLVQRENIKNYFLSSNKYRFASDHRFSPDPNDYRQELFEKFANDKHHKQWGWMLAIPRSELRRMAVRYIEVTRQPVDPAVLPDLIVLDHNEVAEGLVPDGAFYREAGSNKVFRVYLKTSL